MQYFELDQIQESVVYKSNEDNNRGSLNVSIMAEPDLKRTQNIHCAYFKVYNNSKFTLATKVARIRFKYAVYEIHPNAGKPWFLSYNEISELYRILRGPATLKGYENMSVWDALKEDYKKATGIDIKDLDLNPSLYYNLPTNLYQNELAKRAAAASQKNEGTT